MKKILAIGHSFVLAQNRDVLRFIHAEGKHSVTLLAPRFFHGDLRDITVEQEPVKSTMTLIPIDCYMTRSIHFFMYNLAQVEKILQTQSFDAVYLWEEPYILSGFTLARLFKKYNVPYFFFCCQNILKKYPWPFSYFEQKAHREAAGMLACGEGVKEVLHAKGAKNIQLQPFFVSLERFKPITRTQKKEILRGLGLEEDFTVGFMGRLVEEKGLLHFMKTMDSVLESTKCNIIVIGSGPLEVKIKNWLAGKPNGKHLSLKHDEISRFLPALDIMLSPSQTRPHWKEQFGRMIVEAFASGVVVMGSRSGEIPYVIGDSGKIYSETMTQEWVLGIKEVMSSVDTQALYVQRGLKRAQQYSVESTAHGLVKSISETLRW
ncbi:MAG: glycosyltransferase family 4 protein [Bdellovibrionaceae bacterium]|nr:glycosyltransferase family 4 protein [Pseudobdellovibrionaceae bacterium]